MAKTTQKTAATSPKKGVNKTAPQPPAEAKETVLPADQASGTEEINTTPPADQANGVKQDAQPDAPETTEKESAGTPSPEGEKTPDQASGTEIPETQTPTPEAIPEEAPNLKEEAEKLMKQHNLTEIWRCPVTGYWFTNAQSAQEQAHKTKKDTEHFKL